jgi:hypothetical protein
MHRKRQLEIPFAHRCTDLCKWCRTSRNRASHALSEIPRGHTEPDHDWSAYINCDAVACASSQGPRHASFFAICVAHASYDICAVTHQHIAFRAIWETACRAGKLMPGAAQLKHFCSRSAHDHDAVDGTLYDQTLPKPCPRIRPELEYQADRLHQPVKTTQLISDPAHLLLVPPLMLV